VALLIVTFLSGGSLWWWKWHAQSAGDVKRDAVAIPVVTAQVAHRDVPVRLRVNGSVVALQSVELRAQITSTVREVHIREGQFVRAGELLFSLDARAQEANVQKAQAQVDKDKSDLAAATRNFERQNELFRQQFISRAALDAAQNRVDTLTGQLAVDQAALEAARVGRAYTEIRATFAGRTGAIGVRAGSVVQPNGAPLVTVIQIDPILVAFTVPEKELPALQHALAAGSVTADVTLGGVMDPLHGKITFFDNTVDPATGTIRVKAEFANPSARLWPGMFVNVSMSPRTIVGASVVPAQAVQTGPDRQFVYVVGEDQKVNMRPVTLAYVEGGFAVVDGVPSDARVVIEGAQNLRPGSIVSEANRDKANGGTGQATKRDSGKSDARSGNEGKTT
jgi:RND family efflux transporter MFP subunit